PPFDATAPIVLSQLFRTIEERYHGDALQCLLDFLIPSKHLLESVQQAACAGFSDVVFRCEGWPLCLHDKTVIQLAPVNPLLLRPGDFYLQVEPFGDQAARIVLKSLLEEGCREVEETPVPETSYPCIFTEEWLQDLNEGRRGTPLSRCLLCTDQGVIKLAWAEIAIPEFLDKPKMIRAYREAPPEPKQTSVPSHFNSSTLPVETIFLPSKDRMSDSLRPAGSSSKLIKMDQARRLPKSCSKPLIKPVGWVSPNTWDRPSYREIEGDYVDLVDVAKEKDQPIPPTAVSFKPVRPPPPVPLGNPFGLTLQFAEGPCIPCCQKQLGHEHTEEDLKYKILDKITTQPDLEKSFNSMLFSDFDLKQSSAKMFILSFVQVLKRGFCLLVLFEKQLFCNPSGSRDRTGRAVVEVHAGRQEWKSPLVSAQSLSTRCLYIKTFERSNHTDWLQFHQVMNFKSVFTGMLAAVIAQPTLALFNWSFHRTAVLWSFHRTAVQHIIRE
uniref:Uncharacterized protein n=1 Tax=Labrus bergylta TaxID=56723 RepID=A0A3Q3MYX1_9LABR